MASATTSSGTEARLGLQPESPGVFGAFGGQSLGGVQGPGVEVAQIFQSRVPFQVGGEVFQRLPGVEHDGGGAGEQACGLFDGCRASGEPS
ncbi:hypothetical protein [Nonomuraea solani]|uniref:hypothetical protein n=1 Tax=Nonomuraea solani TaxID=1144553 RepID=UPI000CDE931C|nr:hypothetical protein [Nonomuraea solani]